MCQWLCSCLCWWLWPCLYVFVAVFGYVHVCVCVNVFAHVCLCLWLYSRLCMHACAGRDRGTRSKSQSKDRDREKQKSSSVDKERGSRGRSPDGDEGLSEGDTKKDWGTVLGLTKVSPSVLGSGLFTLPDHVMPISLFIADEGRWVFQMQRSGGRGQGPQQAAKWTQCQGAFRAGGLCQHRIKWTSMHQVPPPAIDNTHWDWAGLGAGLGWELGKGWGSLQKHSETGTAEVEMMVKGETGVVCLVRIISANLMRLGWL